MQIEAAIDDRSCGAHKKSGTLTQVGADRFCFGMLLLTVFTIPFDDIIELGQFGTLTRLLGFATIFAGIAAVAANMKLLGFRGPMTWAAFFSGWALLSVTWSAEPEATVEMMPVIVRYLGLTWLLYEFTRTRVRARSVMQAYVFGAYICIGGLLVALHRGAFIDDSNYVRYVVGNLDPNDVAVLLSLGLAMAWYLASSSNEVWRRWVNWAYIPLAAVAVLLTGSRGGFITLTVTVLAAGIMMRPAALKGRLAFLIGLFLAFAVAHWLVRESVWSRLMTIPAELRGGTMAQRTAVWRGAINVIREYPLWGIGLGAYKQVVFTRGIYYRPLVAHNIALGVLADLGFIGGGLLAAWLVSIIRRLRVMPSSERMVGLLLLLVWGVGGLSLSLEYRKITWLVLGLLSAMVVRVPLYFDGEQEEMTS